MGIKKYKVNCSYCGKEFLVTSSTYRKLEDGRQKNCYCSIECKSLSQHTGSEIICDCCGKIFYRRQNHIDRQKENNQNNFCSIECASKFRHESSIEARKCEVCGNEFFCKKNSTQRFCSVDCQNKWQKTQTGSLNSHYNRVERKCPCCGKIFMARRYKIDSQENIFCSVECRQKWYKEVICKQQENIELHRKCALKNLAEQKYSRINSKPQQIIDSILDKNSINYQKEYITDYYSIDNYLSDSGLMIEVMGDYWHCNPIKYNYNDLNDFHKKALRKDKAKHTYILNHYGVEILYLWESDIYNNPELCEKMILQYINQNGKLASYHSFNYDKNESDYIKMEY